MDRDEKIQELEAKLYALANDLDVSRQRVHLLQAELDALKKNTVVTKARPLPAATEQPTQTGIENFIGLNLIHLVGIVALVTGISIGVKYAIDRQLISEGLRIGLAYGAGLILFIFSIRLKKKYPGFSAILFSGSMASLYFTTYAAFVYYQFIPGIAAFLIMVALTVYTVITAIAYDRKEIAIIGMVGAYGIPFLVSTNAERVDLFFSYILLINIGVVVISFKRSWKLMGQLAMMITWILFIGWAILRYTESQKSIGVIFMIAYYALFLINALAFRIRKNIPLSISEVQQIIVNNTALYIASLLVFNAFITDHSLAAVTGYLFLFIAGIAGLASFAYPTELVLQRLLTWQAVLLLLMFIAFEWDGLMVTVLWMAVSVFLFAWGVFGKKQWARLASVFLIGIILGKLLLFDSERFSTVQKIASYLGIGVLLLLFSFYYQKLGLTQKDNKPST